ncbi:hypothetical protein PI124_g7426 [Phytophthora idaei]|nr:hypothetical protein PI125_g10915 [Phytophthora idaei]KAG3144801.1 hypothetical protein PI126_g14002 [Phytophthora idaei]KAG3247897.1 hypothetical protein PI124_g7426 [Phytophthora idaei]
MSEDSEFEVAYSAESDVEAMPTDAVPDGEDKDTLVLGAFSTRVDAFAQMDNLGGGRYRYSYGYTSENISCTYFTCASHNSVVCLTHESEGGITLVSSGQHTEDGLPPLLFGPA